MSGNPVQIDPDRVPYGAIHELLRVAFSAETLPRLCRNHPDLNRALNEFSPDDGLNRMIDKVLEICRQHDLWSELLEAVQAERPRHYSHHEPGLLSESGGEHLSIYRALQRPDLAQLPAEQIRSFETLIDDKTEGFVGRGFVFHAFDRFLDRNKSGYYIIEGEPGIGKTALLAHLVRARGYAHHFNVNRMNIRSPSKFLSNACAQLIARYDLPYQTLPPSATEDSGFLLKCLGDAAADPNNRPVVLVVDALDESDRRGLPRGANLLLLPPFLPDGVFVVVTTRRLDSREFALQVSNSESLFLESSSDGNLLDVRAYIESRLREEEGLSDRLTDWRVPQETFVQTMIDKSEGNFIYLRFVLKAIAQGKFQRGGVQDLPQGLVQYYDRHWDQMQIAESEEFDAIYAPIVCMLAVVREPVTAEQLEKWTGKEIGRIEHAIRQWREFLDVEGPRSAPRYSVYHTSFQDFLGEKVNLKRYKMQILNYYRDRARP